MRQSVWVGAGFAVLCVLAGSTWIADEAVLTGVLDGLPRLATYLAVLAVACAVFGWRGGRASWKVWAEVAVAFCLIFAVPPVVGAAARGRVSELTGAVILMGVPVAVVFAAAQQRAGFGDNGNPLGAMLPALAGIGGAALLIPVTFPASGVGRVWLVAVVAAAILAGLAVERLHGLLQEVDVWRASGVGFGAAAALVAVFCWAGGPSGLMWSWRGFTNEWVRFLTMNAPIAVLFVLTLRRMRPVGFSAWYLLAALMSIAENILLLRPATTWVTWVGLALMAAGAAGLLRADSHEMLGPSEG